jgi:hypothetical protein
MGIGFSTFLIAVGAILTFAVEKTVNGLDIRVVGVILMGAGLVGLVLTMVVIAPRRRRTVTDTQVSQPMATASAPSVVSQQTRTDEG